VADKRDEKGGAGRTSRPTGPSPSSGGDVRPTVERRSAVPLVFLSRLPRWVPPVALAALLIVGLAAKGWVAALATGLLMVVLGWLAYLSWPRLSTPGRLLRVAGLVFLLVNLLAHIGIKP
jgi:O-antigen ligase